MRSIGLWPCKREQKTPALLCSAGVLSCNFGGIVRRGGAG